VLAPELSHVEGAGRIELVGLSRRMVVVRPIPAALASRGLGIDTLAARLASIGRPVGAGEVRDGETVRPLVVRESVASLDELRALRIAHEQGTAVLGDVATVGIEEVHDGSQYRVDGKPAVLLRLFRSPERNAVALARGARSGVAMLRERSAPLELTVVRDGSGEIVGALRGLGESALIGILLGTLVLRWMLGSWRPTIGLSIVIPVSLLLSFAAFFAAGIPIDVISLSGLALAAGMIVDNSVVVLEAIETRRSRGDREPELSGTRQVATAVAAGTVTTAIVFVPLLYLEGVARAFFGEQAFAIVACISASLLFALTLTPVLAKRSGPPGEGRSPGREAYLSLLERAQLAPRRVWLLALAATLASFALVAFLRVELFPFASQAELRVDFLLPRDLTPEESFAEAQRFEGELRGLVPAGDTVSIQLLQGLSREGRPDRPETWHGRIDLRYRDAAIAAGALDRINEHLARRPGVRAVAGFTRSAFVEGLASRRDRLETEVLAASDRAAAALAAELAGAIERAGGTARIEERALPRRALLLAWNEEGLARAGVSREYAEAQIRAALSPSDAGAVSFRGVEEAIRVEPPRSGELAELPVVLPRLKSGERHVVPLGSLAAIRGGERPPALVRIDSRPAVRVTVDRGTTTLGELRSTIARVPAGSMQQIRLSGEAAEIDASFSQLGLVFALGVLLVVLSIAAFYESLLSPLLIMLSVPVAVAGGLVAAFVAGQSLNVMSLIGMILLAGIVVNQTIILVDRADGAAREGAGAAAAMRVAASERYRPILMTTLTAILGMLPLVVLGGDGIELRRALAVTVIGGLVTSTVATLLVVPLLYVELDALARRFRASCAGGDAPP
ncbi:MAG: efflux RND transporter permease subunit, partial [Thermoanaerobaculia bacterium]|nr:efflux RND transporter permease subunit [Thermoanaerobaculia bacterium]